MFNGIRKKFMMVERAVQNETKNIVFSKIPLCATTFTFRKWFAKVSSQWLQIMVLGSHRRPYKHAIFLGWRRASKHAFRFVLCFGRSLVNTPRVYTRNCFSKSMESRFGGPGQKELQAMNEFTLFVDFCLIPLSKTCSFDVPAKNL